MAKVQYVATLVLLTYSSDQSNFYSLIHFGCGRDSSADANLRVVCLDNTSSVCSSDGSPVVVRWQSRGLSEAKMRFSLRSLYEQNIVCDFSICPCRSETSCFHEDFATDPRWLCPLRSCYPVGFMHPCRLSDEGGNADFSNFASPLPQMAGD